MFPINSYLPTNEKLRFSKTRCQAHDTAADIAVAGQVLIQLLYRLRVQKSRKLRDSTLKSDRKPKEKSNSLPTSCSEAMFNLKGVISTGSLDLLQLKCGDAVVAVSQKTWANYYNS